MTRFVELFPLWRNEHPPKDIGMVPRYLARQGYSTEIWARGDERLRKSDLQVRIIGKPFWIRTIRAIWKQARQIDVLCAVHTHPLNPLYATIYRWRNPRGVVYIKADMDESILDIGKPSLLNIIRRIKIRAALASADLMTIEQERVLKVIHKRYPQYRGRLMHLPSGYGDDTPITVTPYDKKRKRIIVVGRIGTRQKATDVVLDVLERCAPDLRGWDVLLVGPVAPEFEPALAAFGRKGLGVRLVAHGPTKDRKEMLRLYNTARILLMPSRWEGFSNVPAEAAHFGNVIIGTAVGGVIELTDNGKIGAATSIDDTPAIAAALRRYLRDDALLRRDSGRVRDLCDRTYTWSAISRRLLERLDRIRASRADRQA